MPVIGLAMSFATLLLVANIVGVKPIALGGWVIPAGTLIYPFTFLVTDAISELYGRRMAMSVVWCGLGMSGIMLVSLYMASLLPAADFWQHQEAYDTILGSVPRIIIGSMVAFFVSQSWDVIVFHVVRRATRGHYLWLRNNASTATSQALDTILFISIAFGGTVPTEVLWHMMATQYLFKLGIAILDTPLVYGLVGVIRKQTASYESKLTPQ